ncbi:endonuclease VII domain-containing protein [Streptomyces glaucosporus]|uniref:endonuclease VII domain-containing protein n=1 Tax=Streptomyces glaucosporus TaxID=284044 RepID=UPI003CD07E8B
MSIEEFEARLIEQGMRCAICKEEFDPDIHDRKPVVDHDHKTGCVRGLLCHKCNLALGHFGDDVNRLLSAVEYLRKQDQS